MLCVTAQVAANQSALSPSGTVTYSIWIWSTTPAQKVTATVASTSRLTRTPRFTLCPVIFGTNCSIGSLPANQAFELMVTDHIRTTATVGSSITLTVVVQGTGLSPAEATSTTVIGQTSPSPSPSPSTSVTLPPSTFPFVPSTTTITPGGLSNLFPVVTPSASAPGSSSQLSSRRTRQVAGLTSSSLPLDPRLIGGQLAALAVLAAAVTMVVARLSLRTPQPAAPGVASAAEAESGDDAKPEG
ncbi:MAG TPA: hypothetical protein VF834_13960 [Streptosporangiaceae bacterium]